MLICIYKTLKYFIKKWQNRQKKKCNHENIPYPTSDENILNSGAKF